MENGGMLHGHSEDCAAICYTYSMAFWYIFYHLSTFWYIVPKNLATLLNIQVFVTIETGNLNKKVCEPPSFSYT
jgi:hypothetical protein